MRYEITGEGWSTDWKVEKDPVGREWQVVDPTGQVHQLALEPLEGGQVIRLHTGGRLHTVTLLPGCRPDRPLRFLLDDEYHELQVQDPIDLLTKLLGEPDSDSGVEEIRSVMPGIIRKVLAQPGDSVALDQPILILEAMKMENEIVAPRSGVVDRLVVQEGQTVATGDLLAVIT